MNIVTCNKEVAAMKKQMGKEDEGVSISGLMSLKGVTPERAAAFFWAAAFFYAQAPWRYISDRNHLGRPACSSPGRSIPAAFS
jgi:hypothetical protein